MTKNHWKCSRTISGLRFMFTDLMHVLRFKEPPSTLCHFTVHCQTILQNKRSVTLKCLYSLPELISLHLMLIPSNLIGQMGGRQVCLAQDHLWGCSTRNAHMVHIVDLIQWWMHFSRSLFLYFNYLVRFTACGPVRPRGFM